MQRHMEQLASLEAAAAEAAAARAAAGSNAQQRGGRGGLGNWSDGGSNEDEDDPWSNAADDAVFGGRPPWAVFGSEDASPPRRGSRGARRSHTNQRTGPRCAAHNCSAPVLLPAGQCSLASFQLCAAELSDVDATNPMQCCRPIRLGASWYRGGRQRPDWGSGGSASSLADAMLGMLSETGSWGGKCVCLPVRQLSWHTGRTAGRSTGAACFTPCLQYGQMRHSRSSGCPSCGVSCAGMQLAGGPGVGHLHMQPQPGLNGGDYGSVGGALAAMRAAMFGLTVRSGFKVHNWHRCRASMPTSLVQCSLHQRGAQLDALEPCPRSGGLTFVDPGTGSSWCIFN